MLSTLALFVALWAVTVVAVVALARLLGRLSAPPAIALRVDEQGPAGDNVVPLVPRERNTLRRAA